MAVSVPLFLLTTLLSVMCAIAGFALGFFLRASASTRRQKPPASPESTLGSGAESAMARLHADQAELFSTLEKLTTTVKRLSSRAGMADLRAGSKTEAPPPLGTDKATLLRYYGMSGKVGPAFAQAQLDLENSRRPN